MKALRVLLVAALIAPALVLTGCGGCCDKKDDACCDKTSGHYSK